MPRALPVLLLLAAALPAQHSTTHNPFSSADDAVLGGRVFRKQCAACHGPDGKGGAGGPDLTSGKFRRGTSDAALFTNISLGIAGTAMPAFAGSAIDTWQLVTFVRSLSTVAKGFTGAGNAARGALLFEKQGCKGCHAIRGEGGNTGPDLAALEPSHTIEYLRVAILEPNAAVSPDYWVLQGRLRDGSEIHGIRLNEDSHSFQYRDKTGLKAVWKSDLAEHKLIRTSAMPSYRSKLSDAEVGDLLAFISENRSGEIP